MKSKILFTFGSIIIGGSLVTGFAIAESVVEKDVESNRQTTVEKEAPKPIGEEYGKPTYDINSYQIEQTEYATLGSFVKDIKDCFEEDSEYRSIQSETSAETALANSVLHYVNYFEADIEKAGLTEAFDAWQQTAHELSKVHGTEAASQHEKLAKTFENQLNDIQSRMK